MDVKNFWLSKTLWVNFITIIGIVLSYQYGIDLTETESTGILAIVNIMLRILTKQPIK